MFTLGVKLTSDQVIPAKGYNSLATAELRMEHYYHRSIRADNWAGLIITNDETGEVESEMEW